MKLLKHKHFMSLIYSVLVALPFFAILGRVIYVQSNKNANLSYYGENINESIKHNGYNDLTTYYELTMGNMNITSQITYTIKNVKVVGTAPQVILDNQSYINSLVFYVQDSNKICRVSFSNGTSNNFWFYGATTYANTTISFYLDTLPSGTDGNSYLYYYSYNNYSYLDNAFEYSLSTFTEENNFGNLDFFSWFSNIFLDTSNTHNMLYINFINWYLNYTLFISLAYILFLVLMWFVSFARRLLENSQNMNIGGL